MGGIQRIEGKFEYRFLTWTDFDRAIAEFVKRLPARIAQERASWFCVGEPRGGLPLAVALSHRLKIPMQPSELMRPQGILWIDDIIDTGLTLRRARRLLSRTEFFGMVWITKQPAEDDILSLEKVNPAMRVVFPWEDSLYSAFEGTCRKEGK